MDSSVVILENSSGFLSISLRLELFLHVLLLQHQILSPETLQLSYSSILVAFFSKNWVPLGAKNMFSGFYSGIDHNIQKTRKLMNVRACQEIIVFSN